VSRGDPGWQRNGVNTEPDETREIVCDNAVAVLGFTDWLNQFPGVVAEAEFASAKLRLA
jgi:hypothetical protein